MAALLLLVEVGADDGDGQREQEHAEDRSECRDHLGLGSAVE